MMIVVVVSTIPLTEISITLTGDVDLLLKESVEEKEAVAGDTDRDQGRMMDIAEAEVAVRIEITPLVMDEAAEEGVARARCVAGVVDLHLHGGIPRRRGG